MRLALVALGSIMVLPLSAQSAPAAAPVVPGAGGVAASAEASPASAPAVSEAPERRVDRIEATKETSVHATPEGQAIGTLRTDTPARVLGRVNGWVRVQVEGWVREADTRTDRGAALTGVTVAEVHADPDRYVGQTVDWRLQLIAVQAADDLRPEMLPGQSYLLTRGPLPEAGFVYVTVTKAQADQMRALPPLQELVLRVTIRAARTRYLETPLTDFVSVVSGGVTRRP